MKNSKEELKKSLKGFVKTVFLMLVLMGTAGYAAGIEWSRNYDTAITKARLSKKKGAQFQMRYCLYHLIMNLHIRIIIK